MISKVYELISRKMKVGPDETNESSSPETVANWDSARHVDLIVNLEQEFGVRFSEDQLLEMTTVGKIIEILTEVKEQQADS